MRQLAGGVRPGVRVLRHGQAGAAAQPRDLGDHRAGADRAAEPGCFHGAAGARGGVPGDGRAALERRAGARGDRGAVRAQRDGHRREGDHGVHGGGALGHPEAGPRAAQGAAGAVDLERPRRREAEADADREGQPPRRGARGGRGACAADRAGAALGDHAAGGRQRHGRGRGGAGGEGAGVRRAHGREAPHQPGALQPHRRRRGRPLPAVERRQHAGVPGGAGGARGGAEDALQRRG
jgi:hypothetical protein